MLAMSLGKHEKPMAHFFSQFDPMMAGEKKYKVACQMGNQGHSGANYFQFKTWTEVGIIAQQVNAKLEFDPVTCRITNHKVADQLLDGAPPRKDWEQFCKL
jgi:hypothetical protein